MHEPIRNLDPNAFPVVGCRNLCDIDGTITTEQPDQMWGMDATSCLTREGTATVF